MPEPLVVRVVRGDTLWGIARRYHVRLATLISVNPQIHDPRLIYAGDKVWIPREAMHASSAGRPTKGTLVLTESTSLRADHHGNIVIQTRGVTLDCAGHRVYGPGLGAHSGGIEIVNADNVTVKRCVVTGFVDNGLYAYGAANLRLEGNTFVHNGNHGVHLAAATSGIVTGNTSRLNGASNPAIGIVTTQCSRLAITGNVASGNRWAGIALFDGTTDSTVGSNIANGNGIGIVLDGREQGVVRGNTIRGNTASRNTHGITILGSRENVIDGNTANHNAYIGFQFDGNAGSNTITGNTANADNDGFNLLGVNENVVSGNKANANRHAGFLVSTGSSGNTLSGNTGLGNDWFDAYDDGTGTGNSWYGNTFRTTSGF